MNADKTGAYIAICRKKLGISQKELADELNISNKTVSKWETGGGFPDISLLPVLAQKLHTSVDSILSGEEVEGRNNDKKTNDEVTNYLLTKRITRFKIQGVITLIAGLIGVILFFFIQNDEGLPFALLASSSFELVSLGIFMAVSYLTKAEFDSYNRLHVEKRNFNDIWKPFAIAGIWLWSLLPLSTLIYFILDLLPINDNSGLLISIVIYGVFGFSMSRKIISQLGDAK